MEPWYSINYLSKIDSLETNIIIQLYYWIPSLYMEYVIRITL